MEPVRTCVGCRTRATKSELLRLTVVDGVVQPDPAQRVAGRAAYLHRRRDCWQAAVGRRALGRALRRPVADTTRLIDQLTALSSAAARS